MGEPKLVPPDLTRCQAERRSGSFMTMGPRPMERCTERPRYIATETEPGTDGLHGSMSLCKACIEVFKKKLGEDFAVFAPIDEEQEA